MAEKVSSKYKGVTWEKSSLRWRARIQFKKRRHHIGLFHSEEEAAKAYNEKLMELRLYWQCLKIN